MSYSIVVLPPFERELRRLLKKYPSIKEDFILFVTELAKNPVQGVSIGKDCYKNRIAITSKHKGKRSVARIIICVKLLKSKVYLMVIYDKSEKENISEPELDRLLILIAKSL